MGWTEIWKVGVVMSWTMPEPRQWWQNDDGVRLYVAGYGISGGYVVLNHPKSVYSLVTSEPGFWRLGWRQLIGCDSFSWEEPKFPPTASLAEICKNIPIEEMFNERYREIGKAKPAEPISEETVEKPFPSNQQLFEAVANLRDQMDRMNKRFANQGYYPEACINLRVPRSGDPVVDDLIRAAVRRDIAVAFANGSLAFSPGFLGRSDWQDSEQLADLPGAAVAFADDMLKQLGFSK